MKTAAIIFTILILGGSLCAQQSDPCLEYLKKPTEEGYRAARRHLDSLLSKNSEDRQALLYSAYVDQANLIRQLDRLYQIRDSLEGRQLFGLGNLLLETGEFQKAVDIYQRLNDKMPRWSCPWRHRGEALFRLGYLAEAEQSLLKAVETRPNHYDAWVWLARVQKNMGKPKEALASIKKAFQNRGRDVEDPAAEIASGDDLKLLDEILRRNGIKPSQMEAERQKIMTAGAGEEDRKR